MMAGLGAKTLFQERFKPLARGFQGLSKGLGRCGAGSLG